MYVTIMRTFLIFPYISSKNLKHTDAYGHAIVPNPHPPPPPPPPRAEILSEVVLAEL